MRIAFQTRLALQHGVTLVELMISLTLGMLVVAATTALLLSTKRGYAAQDETTRMQDTGNYAIEMLSRAIRQAAYVDWSPDGAPISSTAPNITGYDASRISAAEAPLTDGVINSSDALIVHFFGSGSGSDGDGTMIDCGGIGVPAPTSAATADQERGTSIFYVDTPSNSKEPELYCRRSGGSTQPIASGVESFQVLYGLDTDGDSLPNRFLTANAITALGDPEAWKKVVSVKVALLLRGSQSTRDDALTMTYDLFGKDYGDLYASTDIGTRISEAALPASTRNRARKVFSATIQLRNAAVGVL